MANRLVLQTFSVALPACVQTFRPGDVILDTDPNFSKIVAAAPTPGVLTSFPLAPAVSAAADRAIADRLRAVPDDIVSVNLLAAIAG